MMDKSVSKIVARDWRADVKNEARQKVVENICTKLKEQWSAYNLDTMTLKKIADLATNFEKEMFTKAITKDQYVKRICKKMNKIENHQGIDTLYAKPGAIAVSPSTKNLPAFCSDVNDKSLVQVKKEEVSVSQPLSQMINQQFQQPVAPYQLLQKNIQQLNVGLLPQCNIHVNHHPKQQNHIISQDTRNQHLLQPALTPQPDEHLHGQELNARMLQQNQQFGMRNQSSVHPQNILNSPYQSWGLQSHVSGIQMSQDMLTPHSNVVCLQPNENLIGQIKEKVIGEGFQVSTSLHHYPSVIEQHKQHQSHGLHMGFRAASMENLNVERWYDQAYLELQSLKETHLPVLKKAYEKASKQCSLVGQTEMIQKFKSNITAMERMMSFLQLPRSRVINVPRQKFHRFKQSILQYIECLGNRNLDLVNKQALHGKPGFAQSHINLVQRSDNVNPQFQTVKLASSGSPDSSATAPRQAESSRPEANSVSSPQSNSELRVESRSVLTLLQKRKHSGHMAQSQNIKHEFHSPWIQQMQKSREDIQAIDISGMSWQHHLNSEYSQTQVTLSNFLNEASQTSHISSQIDQKILSEDPSASSYGRTSATPLTAPSVIVELGKNPSNVSCLSSSEDFQYPQPCNPVNLPDIKTEIEVHSQEIRSSGTSATLLAEPTSPGHRQQSITETHPFNRLLKAVESMSNEALRAAVLDINLVGNMNDIMVVNSPFETMCYQHATHLSVQDGCGFSNNLKRKITATTFNEISSTCSDIDVSEQSVCQIDNLHSTATSRSKKLKTLPDNALLDEMRKVNQQLVETVLEFDSTENVDRRLANAGTVLRCSYSAVAVSKSLQFWFADTQKLPVLSVKLLVPVDYPNDYPVFLSRFNSDCSPEEEESKDLSRQAKSMLCAHLRTAPEHLSLAELARAWDQCARAAIFEFAQRVGGECFSSRYGAWEDCIAAT